MCYFVYILKSETKKATYVGMTNNLNRRLNEHNAGKTRSTKSGIPWRIFYVEKQPSISLARKREKYFKSGAGRKKIKELFDNLNLS